MTQLLTKTAIVAPFLSQLASAVIEQPALFPPDGGLLHSANGSEHDTPPQTPDWGSQIHGQRDLITQLVLSLSLGLIAFFSFCVR